MFILGKDMMEKSFFLGLHILNNQIDLCIFGIDFNISDINPTTNFQKILIYNSIVEGYLFYFKFHHK
jgi:hypothetical protein